MAAQEPTTGGGEMLDYQLHTTISLRRTSDGWEARLGWGKYVIFGQGDLCSAALADLLNGFGEVAPHWLLEETAKSEALCR
jgi:hypothetical protein